MKTLKIFRALWLTLFLIVSFMFTACHEDDKDTRIFQPVEVVAIYIDGDMLSLDKFVSDYEKVIITLAPGTDVTKLKMKLTTINGELVDFPTDQEHDYTYPMDIKVKSFNDNKDYMIKLRVISRPLLVDFYIEGLTIPKEDVHFSEKSIIVQVPEGTDLTQLNVTMGFRNGEISGFENGKMKDYTNPVDFEVIGIDGTVYPYSLMITDQEVGPASIQSVTANDTESIRVEIDEDGNTQAYFKTLTNFANAALTIKTGYGNEFINFVNGSTVNLWNTPKIKIKGTDGIEREFTLLKPKLEPQVAFSKTPAEMEFGADGGASLCFSGDYLVVSTHNGTPGLHYYDMTGTKVGTMTLPAGVDWGAVMGLRKIASDDKGAIIAVNLAAGGTLSTPYNVYKWRNVTDNNPTVLCSYTASALGLPSTRSAGVNIQGSLDGNAVITVPISATKIVLKWTVTGGALVSATPEKINVDNTDNFGNYSSVEQYPGKANTLVGGISTNSFSGLRTYVGGATNISVSGSSSDLRMKNINGRVYLAHCVWGNSMHTLRLCDITADDEAAYKYNMLWSGAVMPTASNGNATNDADFGYINGKLHVAYIGTNGGVVCYVLE